MLGLQEILEESELTREQVAEMLKVNPDLIEEFEKSYDRLSKEEEESSDNFFDLNAKRAKEMNRNKNSKLLSFDEVNEIKERIVDELLVNGGFKEKRDEILVSNEEIEMMPEALRPELTGSLIKKDFDDVSLYTVMNLYNLWQKKGDEIYYHLFRQGLDILDLDPLLYEMIGMNKNSMGYWLEAVESAADKTGFFLYPKTKVIKVPLPILQLTRLNYMDLSPTTLDIVNKFCMEAFDLDVSKKYFVKTGTFSSKFDFRNALVEGEQEVRELGEYLLFIHFQALQMASPFSKPMIYGVSTTNEWVVREYIEDVEGNPKIYHGMPLHTEYRFFIDLDKKEILGSTPYWREEVMTKSFKEKNDTQSKHDSVIFELHKEALKGRYNENIKCLEDEVLKLINNIDLEGQWSLDIMQNGDDFYIIDMALASESALAEFIPEGLIVHEEQNWLPTRKRLEEVRF